MKKLVFFAITILLYGVSLAQTFTVDGLEYEVTSTNPNEVTITGGTPSTSDLLIPETVADASITYTVVAIANSTFRDAELTSVSFPSTLRQLGEESFRSNFLTSVTIPEGITTIPQRCFSSNDLTSVVLPNSLVDIGFRSFENNEFTSLTLPENVTVIAQLAFRNAPLNTINSLNTLPPSVVLGTSDDSFNNEGNIDLTIPPGTELAYEAAGWIGFNSVNGVVNFEVGDTFTENNFDYEVVSLNPNEVAITGGTAIPENLIIPENVSSGSSDFVVTAIGDSAFIASSLISVTFPSTIRTIGNQAFRNNQLTALTIPPNVVNIGFRAFQGNKIAGNVVIPDSVTGLNVGIFEANNISSISISENLTAISGNLFRNNNLTTVTIPAGITSIGDNSFRDNPLTEVIAEATTPPSIVNGGSDSFLGSRPNIDLTVPDGTEAAYEAAGWVGFKSVNGVVNFEVGDTFTVNNISYIITSLSPNEVTVTGGTTIPQNLIIPENVSSGALDFVVTAIGDSAFINSSLISVTFPSTIRSIGNSAFRNNSINDLTLPPNIITIGAIAFRNNQIGALVLPNSLTTMGVTAFRNNNIATLTISNNLTELLNDVFLENQLTNIIIPANINTIRAAAFDSNPLQTVEVLANMPPTVNTGGNFDSFGNRNNVDLTVPVGTEAAYEAAGWVGFKSVNGVVDFEVGDTFTLNNISYIITSLSPNEVTVTGGGTTIPQDLIILENVSSGASDFVVTAIGDDAFIASSLTSVMLPNTIKTIGNSAFRGNNLATLSIPDSVTFIDRNAFNDNQLANVTIPNSVSTINNGAFNNNQLTSVVIPNAVTTLTVFAFANNQLTSITLGNSVSTIERDVFFNNPLATVTVLATVPPTTDSNVGDDSFGDRTNINLNVPAEAIEGYSTNANWEGFFSINGQYTGVVPFEFTNEGIRYRFTEAGMPNKVRIIDNFNTGAIIVNEEITENNIQFVPTVIDNDAFNGNNISEVTLPNTILEIDNGAFINNPLTTITIPNSVVRIGLDAFKNCTLETVDLGAGLEIIDNGAFLNNDLTSIIIPASVTTIGDGAFNGNSLEAISSLAIQPPITIANSFGNRSDIAVTVPEVALDAYLDDPNWEGFFSINGQYTGNIPFDFMSEGIRYRITEVGTPNEVRIIDNFNTGAIIVNEEITENNVQFVPTVIGVDAFRGNGLTSIQLPATVVSIEESAFDGNFLATVTIPDSVTSIRRNAFRNNGLETLDLGEGVQVFGAGAFITNQLVDITLPASVTTIANGVFRNNPLATVTVLATAPPTTNSSTNDNSFGNRSGIDLFVPEDSVTAYTNSGQWDGFNSITGITIDITVAPKVFLQGASLNPIAGEEDLMRDSLRENNLLPTTSPYGDGATVDPTVFTTTGANAIVDWVLVELRTGADNDNTTVVNSTSAFVQRDGDIVDLDGTSNVTFTEEEGDYFIAIIHRNHIGILAAVSTSLSNTVTTLDFTQDAAFAKGENLALTALVNGTFAMIAGDADGSSQILNTDITEGLTLAGGGQGYSSADADMNGFVLNSDIQLLILGNSGTVQQFD